nr:MAG TPA: hypothetical protein [Caudoviricetes sp.]
MGISIICSPPSVNSEFTIIIARKSKLSSYF